MKSCVIHLVLDYLVKSAGTVLLHHPKDSQKEMRYDCIINPHVYQIPPPPPPPPPPLPCSDCLLFTGYAIPEAKNITLPKLNFNFGFAIRCGQRISKECLHVYVGHCLIDRLCIKGYGPANSKSPGSTPSGKGFKGTRHSVTGSNTNWYKNVSSACLNFSS